MRVTIEHVEKESGIIFKKKLYGVKCAIDFTEEELQIIKEQTIGTVIVLERPPSRDLKVYEGDPMEKFYLRIENLVRGADYFYQDSIGDAKMYEAELTDKLPELKEYITANAGIDEKKKTLEF